ncbi:MAG TPA: nuclear transport factor 2 family protein [Candidatus Eisenbacteria bacterium]
MAVVRPASRAAAGRPQGRRAGAWAASSSGAWPGGRGRIPERAAGGQERSAPEAPGATPVRRGIAGWAAAARRSWAAAALLALAAAGCAASAAFDPGREAAEVRGVLAAQQGAWNRGDLAAFLEPYWKSDSLTFYSGGEVNHGWEATRARYVRRYQSEGREMGALDFDLHQVAIPASGHAVVRGAWRLTRRADSPHGLFTLILRRFPDGSWKIVHDHTSVAE